MQHMQLHISTIYCIFAYFYMQLHIFFNANLNTSSIWNNRIEKSKFAKKNKDEFVKFSIIFSFAFFYLPFYAVSNLQYLVDVA